jgi:hypothetical protein
MEMPKHLGVFISRDIAYALSGVGVEVCLLYKFDRLQHLDLSLAPSLFVAGVGWAIGAALQLSFSTFGLVTTEWVRKPNRISEWFYHRTTGKKWDSRDSEDENANSALRDVLKDESRRAPYERLVTHVIAGASLAPSALLSSALVTWKAVQSGSTFDITLASGLFMLAVVLTLLNRVKAMEMTQKDWLIARQNPMAGNADEPNLA